MGACWGKVGFFFEGFLFWKKKQGGLKMMICYIFFLRLECFENKRNNKITGRNGDSQHRSLELLLSLSWLSQVVTNI